MAEGPAGSWTPLDTQRLEALCVDAGTLVASLDPSVLSTPDATAGVAGFARLEKLAAAGRVLCAARAADGSAWQHAGHRTPEHWMAALAGGTLTDAQKAIATSRRLGRCPRTDAALRRGDLSPAQAAEVSAAADADPTAEETLVEVARTEPMARLRQAALRVRAAVDGRSAAKRAARHHRRRGLRFWQGDDGEFRFSGSCGVAQGAAIRSAIERWRDAAFAAARAQGRRDPFDATTLDALDLALHASLQPHPTPDHHPSPAPEPPPTAAEPADQPTQHAETAHREPQPPTTPATAPKPRPRPSGSPRHKIIVHVSYQALLRGFTVSGEYCEIDGVGPLPVADVHDLLAGGDAFLAAVLLDGVDVHKVVHFGRHIPAPVRTAIEVRDRSCVVPGCGNTGYFEIDHTTSPNGYRDTGRTTLDQLARLCLKHHIDKTHHGWRLLGGPGTWQFLPPDPPPTTATATATHPDPHTTSAPPANHTGRSPPHHPDA